MKEEIMSHKICFYIRVSTEEQAKNLEGSIKNQKERLLEAVKFKNLSGNFGEVISIYIDRAKSGKDTNRPELQKMLFEISQGKIDLVMVSEISRISRNMKDFSEIWELMKKHSCGFYSLRENFDTTTAAGEMVLYTIANIAQFERRQVSERVSANIKARAKRGLYNGGSVPLGFKLGEKKGYLELDHEMAELVKLCFSTYLEKESLSQSAKYLNDQGHTIRRWKQGGGKFKRLGHFSVDNLHKILVNKAYIGIKVFKDGDTHSETDAVWQPIVDEDIFNRVQVKLKKNLSKKKPHSKKRYPYLLSGITFCKTCGDAMCGKSAHGNGGKIGYYEHSWATKRNSTLTKKIFNCEPKRVLAKKLEPLITEKVEAILFQDKFVRALFEKLKAKVKESSSVSEVNSLKAQIYGFNSQIDALAERLSELPKEVSATPIYKQMGNLEKRKSDAVELLDRLSDVPEMDFLVNLNDYQSFISDLRELWLNAKSATKSKIIQRLIHKIEVGVDSVVVHYNVDKRNLGLKIKKPDSKSGFFKNYSNGSNSLTSGA
ncbi:recombinase family protein [Halobacteriovorax sp. RZ-1]|uniref:recombinase family protein n=2 Tax=Halobacteriovorax TaxID=1652133 RepID=UPI00371AEE40